MIIYRNGRYQRSRRQDFLPGTHDAVNNHYDNMPNRLAAPQDRMPHGPQHLAHQVPFSEIEAMVVDFLNGYLSYDEFFIYTGSIFYGAWSMYFSRDVFRCILENFNAIYNRTSLIIRQLSSAPPDQIADVANRLVDVLNSAITNLRPGHASTNMSISNNLDLRLLRGPNVDPTNFFSIMLGYFQNRQILAAESSYAWNVWMSRGLSPSICTAGTGFIGGMKLSEESNVVGKTKTAARNNIMGSREPVHNPYRAPFRTGIPGLSSNLPAQDTVLMAFGCIICYFIYAMYYGS